MPKPVDKASQDKTKAWLKAHRHKPEKVDELKLDTEDDLKASLRDLHGVSPAEYEAAGGGRLG